MDWFNNMFAPINWRTNINDTLAAYNNHIYTLAAMSVANYTAFVQNYSGFNTNPFGINYIQTPNSIFNFNNLNGNYQNFFPYFGNYYQAPSSIYPEYSTPKTNKTEIKQVDINKIENNEKLKTNKVTKPEISNREFAQSIADTAQKYIGYNEADGSYRKFTNSTEWCADFVTYVVKEAYKKQGKQVPEGFGSWRCENLKQWAINKNKFLFTANKSNQQNIIKTKVKPGDIVIMRENGASHTGIVKSVDPRTGDYKTIEGNLSSRKGSDKVAEVTHKYDDPEVSGFIQLV